MTFLILWLATAGLAAGDAEFTVQTLDGRTVSGRIAELSDARVVVRTIAGDVELAAPIVLEIARTKPPGGEPSLATVELLDDSRLAATAYAVAKGQARIALAGGDTLELSTRQLARVRFRGSRETGDPAAEQWTEMVTAAAAADVIAIRKNAALDQLEGVLGDVDENHVQFELDGEQIPVKRAKIEGLIYYHPADQSPVAASRAVAFDVHGTRLTVASLAWSGDRVELSTPAGAKVSWPAERLARIDFSAGKLRYLSDLEPEKVEYEPYLAVGASESPSLSAFFQPRRDTGFGGGALTTGGRTYRKGLALVSRTTLVYRLAERFGRFSATVGIDDSVAPGGNVAVEIRGDDRLLWQGAVRGGDPPQAIDVDLAGARRLTIFVDYGDDLDVGDYLTLGDAKVTK